ncbi:hypothetical protein ABPG72_015041 [Tetrahymena utriculariae]
MADSLFKSQDSFQNVLSYFNDMGFDKKNIWEAWKNTNHRHNLMLSELIRIQQEQGQLPPQKSIIKDSKEDSQIQQAIRLSLRSFTNEANTEEFIRKEDQPAGLVNLGRTCYFNVVIQTLFSIKELREIILSIDLNMKQLVNQSNIQDEERQKYVNLTKQFQILFSCLLKGQKSFQNPKELFESLREFNGEVFKIGEENDFWEFQNSIFELLERSFSKLYNISESELKNLPQQSCLFLSQLMSINLKQDFFTNKLEDDKKKQLMKQQKNYNPMTELFYGKVQECITYNEGNNELKKFNEYVQGIVSLEVKHGDLYKALEASQTFEIPDYELESGCKTKAKIENKFKKAPQILNFCINRLDFDRKNLRTVKLNNQFYFEKELNLTNFCVQDDQLEGTLKTEDIDQVNKLNRQIKKIEEKLKQCQNPNCAPIQLESCFENILQFLQKQQQLQLQDDFIDIDEYDMELDKATGYFGLLSCSQQELKTTIQILNNYKNQITKQTESLTEKLEKLRKERWQLYRKSKKNIYELFSILMHQGTADSGHYYCYIWNEQKQKWFKYNDSTVTEANEEDLLFEAYGKPDSTKNACCLFYRNKIHKTDYKTNTIVPPQLQEIVNQRDKEFFDNIDRQKVLNALEPFKRKLQQEITKRQTAILKNKDSLQCILELTNFQNFLINLEDFKHYGIRDILIQMIKDPELVNIKAELKDPSNFEAGIEAFFQQIEKICKIPSYLNMNESQISEYNLLKEAHQKIIQCQIQFEMILKKFEKIESYPEILKSLGAIQMCLKDMNPQIAKNSLIAVRLSQGTNYMLQVQLLKGCFNIDCLLQKQNTSELINLTNLIVICLMTFYRGEEKLKKQIEQNLKYTLNTHGTNSKLFNEQLFQSFRTSIDQISKINQLFEKNVQDMRQVFCFKYLNENINLDSEVELVEMSTSLLNNWDKQLAKLTLWRNFFDKLQNKLISNDERLNQEELQYEQYI